MRYHWNHLNEPFSWQFQTFADLSSTFIIDWRVLYSISHLSKWPSDLKINGTQENVTFSDPAFHGLPCGVLLFAVSVSFKNHKIEAPDWLLKNSSHSEGGF